MCWQWSFGSFWCDCSSRSGRGVECAVVWRSVVAIFIAGSLNGIWCEVCCFVGTVCLFSFCCEHETSSTRNPAFFLSIPGCDILLLLGTLVWTDICCPCRWPRCHTTAIVGRSYGWSYEAASHVCLLIWLGPSGILAVAPPPTLVTGCMPPHRLTAACF